MKPLLEYLDSQPTPIGELSLRRRTLSSLDDRDVFEVKLGDDYLMSSLFHVAEEALADLCLSDLTTSPSTAQEFDVVVGGLGLGYTAAAALRHENVRSLVVIDWLEPVIRWHREGLVPLGPVLSADPRCRLVHADFFALADRPDQGFDPDHPGRPVHAILLDIDHSPTLHLHAENQRCYDVPGLRNIAEHLHPGGVFGLWSDDPPDPDFMARLNEVFATAHAEVVTFANPLTGGTSSNTIYRAFRGGCGL